MTAADAPNPRVASPPEDALIRALKRTRTSLLWAKQGRDGALAAASAEVANIAKLQREENGLLMHLAENGWEIPADDFAAEDKAPF